MSLWLPQNHHSLQASSVDLVEGSRLLLSCEFGLHRGTTGGLEDAASLGRSGLQLACVPGPSTVPGCGALSGALFDYSCCCVCAVYVFARVGDLKAY